MKRETNGGDENENRFENRLQRFLYVNGSRAVEGGVGREEKKEKKKGHERKVFPATTQASKDTQEKKAMTKASRDTQARRKGKKGKRKREKEREREREREKEGKEKEEERKGSRQLFPATSKRPGTHEGECT